MTKAIYFGFGFTTQNCCKHLVVFHKLGKRNSGEGEETSVLRTSNNSEYTRLNVPSSLT